MGKTGKILFVNLLIIFTSLNSFSQTQGFIFEPSSSIVLDPNGDGYISLTSIGFSGDADDTDEFEITMFPLPSIGTGEVTSDVRSGPDCGFTDLSVDPSGNATYTALDASNNLIFRFRLSDFRPNAKGYTVFIDTDNLFGSSDPNSTAANPGFEIAVVLRSKTDVFIADIDGASDCSNVTNTYSLGTNHQKAISGITSCGDDDYFYDYYVPFSAISGHFGISTSTTLRMVSTTNTSNTCALEGSVSDIGGVDDNLYGDCITCGWEDLVDSQVPTPLDDLDDDGPGFAATRTDCPTITEPIAQGATTVSGTSEANAAIVINVYDQSLVLRFTDNVIADGAGNWTSNTLPSPLDANDIVKVDATAPGESISLPDCNSATVGATCSGAVIDNGITASNKGICGPVGSGIAGATINLYLNGVLLVPSGGSGGFPAGEVVVNGDGSWYWKCNTNSSSCTGGGNCSFANGVYTITQTVSGSCESAPIVFCYGVAGTSATPSITTTPILSSTTSISGTSTANASIILYEDGVQIGTGVANGSGIWTISSLTLTHCTEITAKAIESGTCISNASTGINVTENSNTPAISCNVVPGDTDVSGSATGDAGGTIRVYVNGFEDANSPVILGAYNNWSITLATPLLQGDQVTATLDNGTCYEVSAVSSSCIVPGLSNTPSLDCPVSPGNYTEGITNTITGTHGEGSSVTINLYIDGDLIGTTNSTSPWSVTVNPNDLYAGGNITATLNDGTNSESLESTGCVVACQAPVNTQNLAYIGGDDQVCEVIENAQFTLENSENLIVYEPYDLVGMVSLGYSVLGNGGDITLTTFTLPAGTTTVGVKASKITPGVTCESFLANTIDFTVNPLPSSSLTVSPASTTICPSLSVDVTVAASELNVNYQLRNNSTSTLVGNVVAGTGGTITLNTGAVFTSAVFSVVATHNVTNCSNTLTNTVSVTASGPNATLSVTADDPSVIVGGATNINVDTDNDGFSYQLYDDGDNAVGAPFTGDGTTFVRSTGPLTSTTSYYVIITGGGCNVRLADEPSVVVGSPDIESVYTVVASQNEDRYSNGDQLASVTDADGAITSAVIASGSLPGWMSLNATTGEITVNDATQVADGTYAVDITTTDAVGGTTTQTVTIVIDPDTEAVYTVNAGQNEDSYSNGDQLASVADTDGAITSAVIASGSLPSWMSLNATTGEITVNDATQVADGTYAVDITTTDADGGVTTQTVSIVIDPDTEAVYTVNAAQNEDSYSNGDQLASVADADGAITSAVIASGSLPSWMSLNATTGEITVNDATQVADGTYAVDITTTDADGGVTTQTVSIVIDPDTEAVYTVNAAQNEDSYSNGDQLASVADADGAITSAVIASGSLPSWMSLNATTGEITVNDATQVADGTYAVDITTTDADGGVTTQTVSIVIDPDTEAVYTVNAAQNEDSYSNGDQLASVADADGAITSAVIASGSLPSWMSLNATTGEITVNDATQVADGTYAVDITTTDADGGVTTQTVSIVIDPDTEAVYTVNAAQNEDSYSNGDQLASVADADGAITSAVIASGSLPSWMSLNATTGEITVNDATQVADGTYAVDITTTDADGGVTTQTVSIVIDPDTEAVYTVNAAQNEDSYSNGDQLASVADADGAITSAVIASGSLPSWMSLNATTGEITVNDATQVADGTYAVDITTTDADGGVTTQTVSIVIDPDTEAVYTVNAAQNEDSYSNGDQLASVADADGAITSAVIASGSLPSWMSLNATTGEITVNDATQVADGTYAVDITTTDADGGVTTQTVSIVIDPDTEAVYTVNAAQNEDSYSNGDQLASVADTDGAITSAAIASGSLPSWMSLNATTGEITVNDATQVADGTYAVDITTTDADGGVTTQTVSIVIDPDTEAVYTVNAAQNEDSYSNGDQLASVADTDGAITSAAIASGSLPSWMSLNATTGEITVNDATQVADGTYAVDITTTDADGGVTTQTVSIVIDPDTEAVYTVNAAQNEDSYSNGDQLASVADTDGAITGAAIASGSLPSWMSLNATTGEITVNDATQVADGTYAVDITTTDADGGVTTQTVSIVIDPDTEAVYTVNAAQNEDSYSNGDQLASVADTDGAITGAAIASGSLPSWMSLNATTGEITVNDATQVADGTYAVDITTTDADGGVATQTVSIVIDPDTEAVYTVNAAQNEDSYSNGDQLASVADTDGAITGAAIASGSLPSWMSLNATTGEITVNDATQVADGTYAVDITTTDADGGVTTQTVSIVIDPDTEAVYTVNAAQNEDSYSNGDQLASVADADGAITSAVIASGTLPSWMSLDATTGEITVNDATQVADGTYSVDITTTDADGGTTTQTVSIVIDPDTEAVYTVNAAQNEDSYSNGDQLASVADADGAITSAVIASGSLPSWMSLNATTGEITVNDATQVADGTYAVDITTTDADGGTTTQTVSIVIDPDTEAVYTVNAAQNEDSYSNGDQLASVADADGAITSAVIASGSLPAWMSLNATTGEITVNDATQVADGTYAVDITTTDADGGVTTQTVSIVIDPDTEAVYTVNAAQNEDSYSNGDQLASVADADGAITSAVIASGTLPSWMSLNATTGEITVNDATQVADGTYSVDITTTDADGGTTTQTVSIVIDPDTEAVYTVNAAQNEDSYSNGDQLASVADADGAITSAVIASGSLPSWMSLNATTGEITVNDATQVADGTYAVDITTTDADGGVTTQTVSIVIDPDTEAVYTVNAAQNEDSYSNGDQLASVADADGAITSAVIASGSLPSWMSLNATTGEITVNDATQVADGTYAVDITTTDADGGVTTQTVSIVIDPDTEAVYTVNAAQNEDSYSNGDQLASVADADGAITSAVIASGSLPGWMSLNATTGEITVNDATQVADGTYAVDITTTDADGGVTTQTVSIVIDPDTEAVYTANAAQNEDSYSNGDQLASVADADGAIISAVIASGSLPSWMSLNATTGEITVNDATQVADGTYSVDITTTDADGGVTTQTVSIVIDPDTEAIYTVNAAQNEDSYSNGDQLASVADADGAITSAVIASGSLPGWMSLNATNGEITVNDATQVADGTYTANITTTDADGGTTTQTVSIVINADTEAVYTVNAAQNEDSYSNGDQLASVADADGAITNAVIASGSLPSWMSLNATTGEITVNDATQVADGTYTVDITTTDADGGTTTQTVSIVINADTEAVYTVNAPQNEDSYSDGDQLASVADADGAITGAVIASGTLPGWMSLDATTGEITVNDATQVANGTYTVDITTTDADGGTTTQTVSIVINADTEAVYTVNAAQNEDSYSNGDQLASVADADGAITSAVIAGGTLPAWMSLNATTGEITVNDATQVANGTYTVDITTTDTAGGTTTQAVSIVINEDVEAAHVIPPADNVNNYNNGDVLASISDSDGPLVSATIVQGSLPPGATIDPVTGEITVSDMLTLGEGTFSVEVETVDDEGGTTVQMITFTILPFDTDGDGIPDTVEQGPDPGNPVDSDMDGIPDFEDPDSDNDGISDDQESGPDDFNPIDTDGDNIPDYLDTDADNDGVPDWDESGTGIPPSGNDTDNDGIDDSFDPDNGGPGLNDTPMDTDNDGAPDYQDVDDDGDGIPTPEEDIDGNEQVSDDDSDGDGTPNYLDNDDDGDTVPTADEDVNENGDNTDDDTDGDGIPDYLDNDDDDDGIPTVDEDVNQNGDPTDDDTDNDGIPNYLDADDDGDGLDTRDEDFDQDNNLANDDCDRDGIEDYLDPDGCGLEFSKGFSPDNDGNNDHWNLTGIQNFPDNEVKIFNRWGNEVYTIKGYNNEEKAWRGQSNGKYIVGRKMVPDGTYFYIIDLGDGSKPLSGYVIIKR